MTLANVYNKRQKSLVRDENMSKSCNFEKKNSIGKQHKNKALSNRAFGKLGWENLVKSQI